MFDAGLYTFILFLQVWLRIIVIGVEHICRGTVKHIIREWIGYFGVSEQEIISTLFTKK